MLLGVFSLADTTVAEVMTPRIDIVAVDSSADREEVIATLRSSEHARLLVYDGHPDAVAGVIYAKDILAAGAGRRRAVADASIRPAALRARGQDRSTASCATSSGARAIWRWWWTSSAAPRASSRWRTSWSRSWARSRTSTTPTRSRRFRWSADDQLRVEGGVALSELEGVLGHSFDREDVSTVGGLVLAEFGRVPRSGEAIDLEGYRLVVEQVVRRRVRRVGGVPDRRSRRRSGATERALP